MQTCPVTGRKHRTTRELAAELDRIDKLIAGVKEIIARYEALFGDEASYPIDAAVGDAWNAAHDAADRLKRERDDVEWNPRPIPGREAGTYDLVKQNID